MNADILDYLSETDVTIQKKVFAFIRRREVIVQFKTPENQKVETVQFVATESANKINLVFKNDVDLRNQDITFKIKIGTDMYFFKARVVFENRAYFIYGPFKIFKLMRRKNTRFEIPEAWAQGSYILSPQKKTLNSKIKILEISNTGIRILVYPQLPRYEKKQQIQISLKIQKRAPFFIDGIIKHAKYNKTDGPTLGVEFNLENTLIKNKIQNICDDLAYALAQNLAVKL